MKDKKKLLYTGGLLLVLGILAVVIVNTASSESANNVDQQQIPLPTPIIGIGPSLPQFVYSAKFICGDSTPRGLSTDMPYLANATYKTEINVHNPQKVPVTFTKKAVWAFPAEIPFGPGNKTTETLKSDWALGITCDDIWRIVTPAPPSPIPIHPPLTGFVVISSPKEIDVVAVYTSISNKDESTTLDVEEVRPKKI